MEILFSKASGMMGVLGKLTPRKIAPPSPNSNANSKPNPDPDRGAIFRTPLMGIFKAFFLTYNNFLHISHNSSFQRMKCTSQRRLSKLSYSAFTCNRDEKSSRDEKISVYT